MRQRRNHTSRQSERPRATSLAIYYTAGRHGAGKGEPIHYSGSRRGAHRTTHILSSVLSRMSKDFVYGPRPRKQLGHPRQWYSHTRLASASRRSAPDYINCPTRRTNAHTVGPSRQWFHGPNVLHPPAESPRPAPTRVTPEHYITSLGQHGIALDTHVVRASLLRLSHNKRILTRPCVALTASTAAGMTYGPTTILMSAPLPANAA